QYAVVTSADELSKLGHVNEWMKQSKLVAKAHEALGSRFKLGLVKVGLDLTGAVAATKDMIGRQVGSIMVSQVIVSEMIAHKEEYYCAVKSTREGSEILVANCGGIEVESNWDRVKRLCLDVGQAPSHEALEKLAKEAGFTGALVKKMADFAGKMFSCFDSEDAQYLEVNPVVTRASDGELVALDAVTLLDGDAKFRHPDWNFAFAAEFGRAYSKQEEEVMAVDSKIKGSVKFIEIPGGDTAMLPAGGGASVYYSDAVVARGGKLANYAEYSGDPPDWAVEVLTEKVCSLPGIKNIIVGGAIANFTDVVKTFGGIINGFRKAKAEGKLKGVKIWVRRGGPREKEGLDAMRALKDEGFDINVFDRNTPLTDIVDKALQK
ncbi:MAG: ATP citrate lyase citrate-binding domain-containing protein, partial [Nitrospira sp.]